MRKSNFNIEKGVSNVKSEETILYRPNLIDVEKAEVVPSGKGEWCDFEMIGSSKTKEGDYKNQSKDSPEVKAAVRRAKLLMIGRKIQSLAVFVLALI